LVGGKEVKAMTKKIFGNEMPKSRHGLLQGKIGLTAQFTAGELLLPIFTYIDRYRRLNIF
jgi:hypothetical protein